MIFKRGRITSCGQKKSELLSLFNIANLDALSAQFFCGRNASFLYIYTDGVIELFPAFSKMTYAFGDDASLAVTNHEDSIAVLARTDSESTPYEVIYRGEIEEGLDTALFDTKMTEKKNSTARYQYSNDTGLVVAAKEGKVALVQNQLLGGVKYSIRNASLECAIIDERGVIYHGRLKSDIVDLDYDMTEDEIKTMRETLASGIMKQIIEPVRNENWAKW